MSAILFPSREWVLAAATALHLDASAQAALADFGAVTVGIVVERGDGLGSDFCLYAKLWPGKPAELQFPDDEDELEELEPDYLGQAPHALVRELLLAAQSGQAPDPLQFILSGRVKVQGDVQRLVRLAGKHQHAGLAAIRSIPTRTLR